MRGDENRKFPSIIITNEQEYRQVFEQLKSFSSIFTAQVDSNSICLAYGELVSSWIVKMEQNYFFNTQGA